MPCLPPSKGVGGRCPRGEPVEGCPDLEVIGTGAQDPLARIHAPNESIDLAELQRSLLAQALFLRNFGARA